MAWTLAGNLEKIEAICKADFPGLVVFAIGDQAHQAEHSDHNPDSRGVVHAIDLMFQNDTNFDGGAPKTLDWLLTPGVRVSLEYVIHDRSIWSVGSGWQRRNYLGTDPHTNHIHVSGKHGSVGENAATGTGYSLAAEKMTPVGTPLGDDMPLTQADANLVVATLVKDKNFQALIWRVNALVDNGPVEDGPTKGEANALAAAVAKIPTTAAPAAPADIAAIAKAVNDDAAARLDS